MSKIRIPILIVGSILLCVISSLITYLALASAGAIETNDPIELVYSLENQEKVYDGKPLEATDYTLDSGTLKKGHKASVNITGSITSVGTETASLSVKIIDDNGFDVTTEYNIKTNSATLTVTPRPLEYEILDAEMEYNGQELTYDAFKVLNDGLLYGHTLIPEIKASVTNYEEKNEVTDVTTYIYDISGNNVTSNYEITYTLGDLTVTKRNLVISPIGKTKEYDGTILTCDDYKIDYGTLVDGHTIEATYSDGIANAGSLNGFITSVEIFDSRGVNVTNNYNVGYDKGALLTVTPRDLVINMANKSKTYDRTILTCNDYTISEETPLLKGDVFEALSFSADSSELINVGSIINTITDYSIKTNDGLGDDVTSNYNVVINTGKLEITKAPLTLTATSAEWIYDGQKHTLESSGDQLNNEDLLYIEGLVDRDNEIIEFNYSGTITDAGTRNNNIILESITLKDSAVDIKDNYEITLIPGELVVVKAKLIVTGKSETKEYDGKELTYKNINEYESVIGLKNDNETITIKYTDEGITNVGQMRNVIEAVYVNNGKISNYDVELVHGYLTVTPRDLELKAKSLEVTYDGLEHSLRTSTELLSKTGLLSTDYVVFNYEGSLKDVGSVENKIANVRVLSLGYDATSNYNIICENGTITVKPLEIKLMAESAEKQTYDGYKLEFTEERALPSSYVSNLLQGHSVYVKYKGSIVNVGSEKNSIDTYRIVDGSGTDVTGNYKVTEFTDGKLTIKNKLAITLQCKSVTLEYNGYNQSYYNSIGAINGVYLNERHLANTSLQLGYGDTIQFVYSGEVMNYNETGINTIDLNDIVFEGDNKATLNDYAITVIPGEITITRKTITVTAQSATKVFDGVELTFNDGLEKTADDLKEYQGLVLSHNIIFKYSGTQINAGSTSNEIVDFKILDDNDIDVSSNYLITIKNGTLEVTKLSITLTAESDTLTYTGNELVVERRKSNSEICPSLDSSYQLVFSYSAKATDAGVYENSINNLTILLNSRDVTESFEITINTGTLTIEKAELGVYGLSSSREYNGTALTLVNVNRGYESASGLASGHILEVIYDGSITNVGKIDNTAKGIYVYSQGNDVTKNYDITYTPGELEVTKADINVSLANNPSKVYDGQGFTITSSDIRYTSNVNNITIKPTNWSQDYVANTFDFTYAVEIYNGNNENVSSNFNISYTAATATIIKRDLIIEAYEKTVTYDINVADININSLYGISSNTSLAQGDLLGEIEFEYEPVMSVGSTILEIDLRSIKITKSGVDVTSCYSISTTEGSYTVKPYQITVELSSFSKTYDGTEIAINANNVIQNSSAVPMGMTIRVERLKLPLDLKSAQTSTYSAELSLNGDNYNYEFIITGGTINIEKRSLSIVGLSGSYVYDGLAHSFSTSTNVESAIGLASTDAVTVAYSGSITNVGKVSNVITSVNVSGGNDNYIITVSNGTIEVTKRSVVIVITSQEFTYDGIEHKSSDYETTDQVFMNDQNVDVVTTGAITNVGSVTNYGYVTGSGASNYDVTIIPGTITVS